MAITTIGCTSVLATPTNTKPVSHDRPDHDFSSDDGEMTPPVSRFRHRHDYREEEKEKADEAEAQKKQAVENALKARQAALQQVKDKEQASVNANNRGVALGQQHRWVEAISAHEEAVQLDPRSKQFRINLSAARCAYGQEKLQQGDLNAAASLFRKAKAAESDNGLADKLLIATMKKQGRDPSNPDTRIEIGDQLSAIGDMEGATIEYEAAMQLQPNARSYTKMGDVALGYGQASTALKYYREAIAKDPEFGPAHRQLGMVALNSRDYTTAATSLRKALLCDPKDAMAGETLLSIWRRQVANSPQSADMHLGLAGALTITGNFADAENEYRKIEAIDPRNAGLAPGKTALQRQIQHAEAEKYKAAADTLFNQGLQREALAEISRAVTMEPRNAKYQFLFAQILEANGNYQAAHQAYMNCVLIDPEHNAEAAARIREMQHNLGGRINFSQTATKLPVAMPQFSSPQQSQFSSQQAAQAMMQAGSGQTEPQAQTPPQPAGNAMSAAGQAQAAQPQRVNPQEAALRALQEALARVSELESQKKYDDAIDLLKQIVQRNLQNAEFHHRLAVDQLANGMVEDAVAEFRMACALRPDKSDYAADLARALQIHKQALAATTEAGK